MRVTSRLSLVDRGFGLKDPKSRTSTVGKGYTETPSMNQLDVGLQE